MSPGSTNISTTGREFEKYLVGQDLSDLSSTDISTTERKVEKYLGSQNLEDIRQDLSALVCHLHRAIEQEYVSESYGISVLRAIEANSSSPNLGRMIKNYALPLILLETENKGETRDQ